MKKRSLIKETRVIHQYDHKQIQHESKKKKINKNQLACLYTINWAGNSTFPLPKGSKWVILSSLPWSRLTFFIILGYFLFQFKAFSCWFAWI